MQESNNAFPSGKEANINVEENEALVEENETITGDDLNGDLNNGPEENNETAKLKEELEISKDKYIRLFAEFDNYKRRNAKERIELIQTAGKEVITSMLDVMDDCDRAEKQINNSDDITQIKAGIQLVFNKLRSTMQSNGLKAMDSIGTPFDVEKHEAITEIEVDKNNKGKVVDQIVKGYYLNAKLIRFAKVVVGK